MPLSLEGLLAISAASGASFSLIGVAYRLGQSRHVPTPHLVLISSLIVAVVFAVQAGGTIWSALPARVWVLGVIVGVSQYGVVKMVPLALRLGPLTPLWCAVNLGFLPSVPYCYFWLGEGMGFRRTAALATAVGCVVAASLGKHKDNLTGRPATGPAGRGRYAAALVAIVALSAVTNIVLKYLCTFPSPGAGRNCLEFYRAPFLVLMSGTVSLGIVVDLLWHGWKRVSVGQAIALGSLASAGSAVGLSLGVVCARGPGAAVFTVSSSASILAAALISVLAFKEKASLAWFWTVGLAVLTVVLAAS